MSFLSNAASLLATSIVVTPIGFLTTVLLARVLAPADFGTYSVLISFTTITTLLSQLGWPSATIYRIRRVGVPLDVSATAGLIAMTGTSVLAVAVCWGLERELSARFLDGAPIELVRYALPIIPAMIFGRWFVGLCRALDRFDLDNAYRLAIVAGTLIVLAVLLLARGGGLEEALLGVAGVHVVTTLVLGVVVLSKTGLSLKAPPREIADSVRYGLKTYAQAIATQLHEQIDIFMLAALAATQADIAYYAVAVGIVNRLKIVPDSIATALFPQASSLDHREAAEFAAAATRHAALWVLAMTVALAIVAPVLVPLVFGASYSASVAPLLVLLPAMMCMTLSLILSRFFMAFDRQAISVVIQSTATVANIAMNYVLIPRMGVLGAAVASLASYLFTAICMVWAFRAETGLPVRQALLVEPADLASYRERIVALRRRAGGRAGRGSP